MAEIVLVRPCEIYENEVMSFRQEMLERGESFDGCACLELTENYREWLDLDRWLDKVYGEGHTPSEVYLAVRSNDGRVVGVIDYRHPLSKYLKDFGGNIGYSVRPSERRKGYASEMLRLMLGICREYGETRVLLTCGRGNDASMRTILRNGGVFESEVCDPSDGQTVQRYWIDLQ